MNKKILSIIFSLLLVAIVGCSNDDKTGSGTSTPKTINTKYSGIWEPTPSNNNSVEIDINGNIYEYNTSRGTKGEIIEANDPVYKVKIYEGEATITFNDENSATVNINGEDITYTKTSKGIEQFNGNTYVSTKTFDLSSSLGQGYNAAYVWISVKDSKIYMYPSKDNNTEPSYQGYFNVTGYGTDYSFSTDYYGEPNAVVGTLKFSDSSVTVRYTKNPGAPQEMLNKDIVCNKKQ